MTTNKLIPECKWNENGVSLNNVKWWPPLVVHRQYSKCNTIDHLGVCWVCIFLWPTFVRPRHPVFLLDTLVINYGLQAKQLIDQKYHQKRWAYDQKNNNKIEIDELIESEEEYDYQESEHGCFAILCQPIGYKKYIEPPNKNRLKACETKSVNEFTAAIFLLHFIFYLHC